MNKLDFIKLFLFISQLLFLAPVFAEEWTDDDEKILTGLLNKEHFSSGISEKKVVIPIDSSVTRRLLFIKDKTNQDFVVKIFHDYETYEREKEGMNNANKYSDLVEQYSKTYNVKLPHLIKYIGAEQIGRKLVVIMTEAKGEELDNLFKKIPTMEEEKIKQIFADIGQQLGNLTRVFSLEENGILIHPDPHSKNMFYDESSGTLSWIDTAALNIHGLLHVKKYEPNNEKSLVRYYEYENLNIWFIEEPPLYSKGKLFPRGFSGYIGTLDSNKIFKEGFNEFEPIKKGLLAYRTFYENYIAAVSTLKRVSTKTKDTVEEIYKSSIERAQKIIEKAFGDLAKETIIYLGLQ